MVLAAGWWGKFLSFSSPGFIILEGLSSLLVVQSASCPVCQVRQGSLYMLFTELGQEGKQLVSEGEDRIQFSLLIGAAAAYVASAWWIVMVHPLRLFHNILLLITR
jgi:hypothetical protein